MRKVFSVAMLIVGTMIGAGFCSGREIVSFFGSGASVFTAPLCGVAIFACCVLFLTIGAKINAASFDAVNGELLGKYRKVADIFLLINNLIVLSAMIAGFNSLMRPVTRLPVFGGVAAVVCAFICSRGNKGMLDCNFLVVPVIIISLATVCFSGISEGMISASVGKFGLLTLPMIIVYVSMNMMLASTVLTTLGKLSRKQIVLVSLIASAVIAVLMALIIAALNSTGSYDGDMPILEVSGSAGKWLRAVLYFVTGVSIFTTMLTAVGGLTGYMHGKFGGRIFDSVVVVSSGIAVSFLGFTKVVSLFYPLVGLFGIAYIAVCVRYVVRTSPKRRQLTGGELSPYGVSAEKGG